MLTADVVIIGSGPVGSAFARKLAEGGRSILMLDAGAYQSERAGAHMKNSAYYQQNIDKFSPVVSSHLLTASVPTSNSTTPTLDPVAFHLGNGDYKRFQQNNQNPDQDPQVNLDGAAVAYAVGGMATHWTCATPRHHPEIERCNIISDKEWNELYKEAELLLLTNRTSFNESVRNTIVKEKLQKEYGELSGTVAPQNIPLAGYRLTENPELMHWTGSDDVLGPLLDDDKLRSRFTLKAQHLVEKLVLAEDDKTIEYAVVRDLQKNQHLHVHAKLFIVAAGAILTPQLLFNSGIRPDALGRYLSEQPLAFTQVIMRQDLIDSVRTDERFKKSVEDHHAKYPDDPLPFRFTDPDPQLYIPVSENRRWHCQVHRDSFAFGAVKSNIDSRTVVDFRWFGIMEPRLDNYVTFSETIKDNMGMPQPTFHVTLSEKDRNESHSMMQDMIRAATSIGGFLPDSPPQFMAHGTALHMTGTVRMGQEDDGTSVVDEYSRVWGMTNLYVGGNGVIPTGTASNPTLTSVALAVRSAQCILRKKTK